MFARPDRALSAYRVYLAMTGTSALFFAMLSTIGAVYMVKMAGLGPLQLVLVGTTLEAAAFLFEVPTGVVADAYSRRLSIVVGMFLSGAGFVLWGAVPHFAAILLAQVLWGIGFTFTSGAQEAWITDEVGETHAGHAFLRGAQAGQAGALAGIVAGVVLACIRLNLPIVVAGLGYVALGLFLIPFMPERGFAPSVHRDHSLGRKLSHTLTAGARLVWARPVLLTILGIAAFSGAASEAFDRLWEVHFLTSFAFPSPGNLDPIAWFGILNAGALLLSVGATEAAHRRLDTTSHAAMAATLLGTNLLLIGAMAAFGLAGSFGLAAGAFWTARVLRRVNIPLTTAWLNQSLAPGVRATVISMHSQVDALGQIAGGPLLGVVAGAVSIRAAIVAAAAVLAPALALYARTLRGGEAAVGVEPALAREPE